MRIAVIAGSGLSAVARRIEGERRPWTPEGTPARPAAPGHEMEVFEGRLAGMEALGFAGRLHWYQGYSMAEVAAPVRAAHRWGAGVLVVTNAAGALNPALHPGDLMLIRDHINLMPDNPLRGEAAFVDMTGAYDAALRGLARAAAADLRLGLADAVYAGVPGPSFETPAELAMLRLLGGDAVGMSTVPEVIAARHLGMRVLGLSLIANAAGAEPAIVLRVAREGAGRLGSLVEEVTRRLGQVG